MDSILPRTPNSTPSKAASNTAGAPAGNKTSPLPSAPANQLAPTSGASTSKANKNTSQQAINIDTLVQQLKTKPSIHAEVKNTQLVDGKTQQLINRVNPSLAEQLSQRNMAQNITNKPTTTPNTSLAHLTSGAPLSSRINIASATSLYLVKLSLNQQTLTTITSTPFKVGDKIELSLNSQQNIIVKPSLEAVRPAIINGLRQTLPQQQNTSQLLNTIQLLQQLPTSTQESLLSKPLINAIKVLNTFIATEKNMTTPQAIKNTLHNSGPFFENKLQTLGSASNDLRMAINKLQQVVTSENKMFSQFITDTQQTSSSTTQALSNNPLSNKAIDLLLGHLVQLYSSPVLSKTTADTSLQSLGGILQLLGLKPSHNPKQDAQSIKEAINKQLSQMANNSQEKIHLNQLRALNTEMTAAESGSRPVAIHTEIPLRWGEQILPLQVSIQEQIDEKLREENKESHEQEKDTDKNITRRWQVFLSFDLPNNEQLFTQLIIVDESVSATVWTESATLCEKAKQQLQHLRKNFLANGLLVEDLTCINGKPPSQELSLDYNLVDIKT